ncbi:MAG TPA: peptidase, partial [Defluviicoccus sp.]|nr:peptidase [Defluviicoccus sp.]
YFQLGETKYGKPILERIIMPQTTLAQVAKCALLSFDGTIKANLSVAPPIDVLIYKADTLAIGRQQEIAAGDPYFATLSAGWGTGLLKVFADLADPPWAADDAAPGESG